MTTTDVISPDLKTVLRRLKLSRMLDTLPERLTLARQQKMPHQDLLLQVLSDEVTRRDSLAVTLRVQKARLDPTMRLEHWDSTAKVTLDRTLLNELASLRFLDAHAHVAIVGPVGVGKTFLAHALGHIACRRGASVLAVRTDAMLKTLKHARLDHTYDAELRKLIGCFDTDTHGFRAGGRPGLPGSRVELQRKIRQLNERQKLLKSVRKPGRHARYRDVGKRLARNPPHRRGRRRQRAVVPRVENRLGGTGKGRPESECAQREPRYSRARGEVFQEAPQRCPIV